MRIHARAVRWSNRFEIESFERAGYILAANAVGYENDARTSIFVRPVVEGNGLVEQVLHGMYDDRPPGNIEQPLDAQQIRAAIRTQQIEPELQSCRVNRCVVRYGEGLNVVVVAGFVFSDLAKNGMSVLVTARSDLSAARALAEDIATRAWDMRDRFQSHLTSLEDAVDMAVANAEDETRPAIILADVADNPGGGGRGNTTWMLSALFEAGASGVLFGIFYDPALAQAAFDAGEGAEFEAVFNSEETSEFSKRFEVQATVITLSDGECTGRRGLWVGRSLSLGPTALLQVGGIKVVVVSIRKQCADPRFFEMFGLDIADARTVVVKSRGHFRAGFDEFFSDERIIEVDVPGLTSPVLSRFDFKNLPRPTIPLDPDAVWNGPKW